MKKTYYNPEDLKKFSSITEWNEALGENFLTTMLAYSKKAI